MVSDNKIRFKTWFKPPIQLDKKKDYEIAPISLETYYSFPNIDRSTIVLLIHLTLTHYGLTLLLLKAVITLKISMSSLNEKLEKMVITIKQTIWITLKYLLITTH